MGKMDKKRIEKIILPVVIVFIAAFIRVLPHIPNVTPIAAMALFGGAYLDKKWAFAFPFLAMIVSDIFLGFHLTMIFVYASFAVTVLLGVFLKNRPTALRLPGFSLLSSVLFFLVTNFGVWFLYDFYPKNFSGLINSYVMGIPFFRNTLIGDIFYTFIFFGSFELVKKYVLHRRVVAK